MVRDRENANTIFSKLVFSTLGHPFDYAKILIQIGHEPIPARPGVNLFGTPVLKLPNIFQYVKYIYTKDGFTGCYRGLSVKLVGNVVSVAVREAVLDYLDELDPIEEHEPSTDSEDSEKQDAAFVQNLKHEVISRSVGIIVSHPFHVITIRMMAEFVGREAKYNGLLSGIMEIYRNEGILGFFNGLIPRFIAEIVALILASGLTYYCNKHLIEDQSVHSYTSMGMSVIATSFTYRFNVISSCMAVTGSGQAAGLPPNMPIYSDWWTCWSHLSVTNQLSRGSNVLYRVQKLPRVVINKGVLRSN